VLACLALAKIVRKCALLNPNPKRTSQGSKTRTRLLQTSISAKAIEVKSIMKLRSK
jgi:hypothetical protein